MKTALLVDGFVYGEGPRWHDDRLWFTDSPSGHVLVLEDGVLLVAADVPKASGLGWLSDGTIVVSLLGEAAIVLVRPDGPKVRYDLGHLAWSTNDVVVHDDRIFIDLYRMGDGEMQGAIGLVSPDGGARVVADNLAFPNGMVVTSDGSTLIASETFAGRLVAFTITPGGDLTDQRVFADLGVNRHPDGLCLDSEGALWVGCYDTGEFLRVRDGGEVTDCVPVSPGWAVAPALGGPDGRTLFLVVDETTHEGLFSGESTGRVETVEVAVPAALC
jgi:sugar lactone lactonase YvrE